MLIRAFWELGACKLDINERSTREIWGKELRNMGLSLLAQETLEWEF